MKVSERYRQLVTDADQLIHTFAQQPDGMRIDRALGGLKKGHQELQEFYERVGEIPQFQLEAKLSPILLRVHAAIDRARVQYEDAEQDKEAEQIWNLEQQIYRLLNDL
ncbi:MAG: hypothetical protein GW875_10105 [Deltaproteobacteria bacterium]|nr:hypothetical protein [Deltaproteobacteria bacterium]NCP02108.1 hypothetical protein [Deltaproteobacteria bacterium]